MVGLPARGKTHTAQKLNRYLRWLGFNSQIFDVGHYRRDTLGAQPSAAFFDHGPLVHSSLDCALLGGLTLGVVCFGRRRGALQITRTPPRRACAWPARRSATWSTTLPSEAKSASTMRPTRPRPSAASSSASCRPRALGYAETLPVCWAARPASSQLSCTTAGLVQTIFVECICDNEDIIAATMREELDTSPDYRGVPIEEAKRNLEVGLPAFAHPRRRRRLR